jgi:hypothetical protein
MPPITVDWLWEEVEPITATEDRSYAAGAQWAGHANTALPHCVWLLVGCALALGLQSETVTF